MSGKELFTYKKVTVSGLFLLVGRLFLLVGRLFLLVGRLFLLVVIVKNNRQTVMLTYQIQNNQRCKLPGYRRFFQNLNIL
jgi:hypothetical protein